MGWFYLVEYMEDMKTMIDIIYEDNHLLVVNKPVNIPTQEDITHDTDLLSLLKGYLKEKYNKPGNVYLGLVHRLDRPVGGVMVFAKTSKAASRLSEQIRNHDFKKVYYAVVENKFETNNGSYVDYLLKDTKNNIVKVEPKGKKAELDYLVLKQNQKYSLVKVTLKTGRSHQIRVQFAHHHHPLYGDQKYNHNSKPGQQIALFSKKISFNHPVTKQQMEFSIDLPNTSIWSQF